MSQTYNIMATIDLGVIEAVGKLADDINDQLGVCGLMDKVYIHSGEFILGTITTEKPLQGYAEETIINLFNNELSRIDPDDTMQVVAVRETT